MSIEVNTMAFQFTQAALLLPLSRLSSMGKETEIADFQQHRLLPHCTNDTSFTPAKF